MANYAIDISDFENDPRLFLFTSLTAGSSHIITATSRMETILKANKIPFQAIDLATDEKARRLWQRRAKERKLPGLVKDGFVLGDLDEIEEWNEFGELKDNIGPVPASNSSASNTVKTGVNIAPPIPIKPTATQGATNVSPSPVNKAPKPGVDDSKFRALPGAAEMAERHKAKAAEQEQAKPEGESVLEEKPAQVETMTSAADKKQEGINAAKAILKENTNPKHDHLSAPPSGTATPHPESAGAEATEATPAEIETTTSKNSQAEPVATESTSTETASADVAQPDTTAKESPFTEPVTIVEPPATDSTPSEPAADPVSFERAGSKSPFTEPPTTTAPEPSEEVVDDGPSVTEAAGKVFGKSLMQDGGETADSDKQDGDVSVDSEMQDASAEAKEQAGSETATTTSTNAKSDAGAASVQATDAGEGEDAETIEEQSAKEADNAGKSVGD